MAVKTQGVPLDEGALVWLALALVPELLPRRAFALVERFGTPRAVLEATAGALAAADVPPAVVAAIGGAAGRPRAETLGLAAAAPTTGARGDGGHPPPPPPIAPPPPLSPRRGRRGRRPRPGGPL